LNGFTIFIVVLVDSPLARAGGSGNGIVLIICGAFKQYTADQGAGTAYMACSVTTARSVPASLCGSPLRAVTR
jgi:hypothetical protein